MIISMIETPIDLLNFSDPVAQIFLYMILLFVISGLLISAKSSAIGAFFFLIGSLLYIFASFGIYITLYVVIAIVLIAAFLKCFFEYLEPYQVGLREKFGKLESKLYEGGVVVCIPFVHRLRRVDTRIKQMWTAFWGERGRTTSVFREHSKFYKKLRWLSKIHTSIDWDENDFQVFGPLITREGILLNAVVSVFYRIEDPYKLITTIGEMQYKAALAAKLASSLRAVVAKLSLDEVFEERAKLVELTQKQTDDVAAQWGIDVVSVALEELFLEDITLQESLDKKRVEELRGEVNVLKAKISKELTMIKRNAEEEVKLLKLKAEEEEYRIEQEAKVKVAKLMLEKEKLLADLERYRAEVKAAIEMKRAEVEERMMKYQAKVVTDELIKLDALKKIPSIVNAVSRKLVILPETLGGGNLALLLPYLQSSPQFTSKLAFLPNESESTTHENITKEEKRKNEIKEER